MVGLIVIIFFFLSIVASNGMGEPLKEYSSVIRSSTLALVINESSRCLIASENVIITFVLTGSPVVPSAGSKVTDSLSSIVVNDAEDAVVRKTELGITLDSMEKAIDEQFTFSNVPEGTSIAISGVISGTMDASGTLTLTAKTAGEWRVVFTKDKFFEVVYKIFVKRRTL